MDSSDSLQGFQMMQTTLNVAWIVVDEVLIDGQRERLEQGFWMPEVLLGHLVEGNQIEPIWLNSVVSVKSEMPSAFLLGE